MIGYNCRDTEGTRGICVDTRGFAKWIGSVNAGSVFNQGLESGGIGSDAADTICEVQDRRVTFFIWGPP